MIQNNLFLNGLNPLPYGILPAQLFIETVDPTSTYYTTIPYKNFQLGTFWLNKTNNNLWYLASIITGPTPQGNWLRISSSTGNVETLTGNSGGAVSPTASNINLLGDGTVVSIVGNPGTSTLTTSIIGRTNHSLQLGNGAGTLANLGVATNGQLPIGSTGADPVLATLTAGSGITITNGAGSISIASSGNIVWSVITADQTAVVNNGYICNKGSTLILTLPTTSVAGDTLRVTGINNATGWQIVQGAGQQIFFGTSSTTLGATGTLTSFATRDSIELVCVVANLTWNVISSIGNITVV